MAEPSTESPWSITPSDPNDWLFGQWMTAYQSPNSKPNLLIYGLPFDGAVLGRKGARDGPRAIRAAARTLKMPPTVHESAVGMDLGDAELPTDVLAAHKTAESFAKRAFTLAGHEAKNSLCRVVALGGDHSLAYPCIKPYLDQYGPDLAVVNLDAHLDIREVQRGQPPNSGTAFRRLLDGGLASYTVIGWRRFQTSIEYLWHAKQRRMKLYSAEEVFEEGAVALANRLLKALPRRVRCIYLSIDVDVADASVAPGCSAPTPGGLLAHQVFQLVRTICSDARTRACGIFELAPNLEEPNSDRTARLAAGCLAEILAPG